MIHRGHRENQWERSPLVRSLATCTLFRGTITSFAWLYYRGCVPGSIRHNCEPQGSVHCNRHRISQTTLRIFTFAGSHAPLRYRSRSQPGICVPLFPCHPLGVGLAPSRRSETPKSKIQKSCASRSNQVQEDGCRTAPRGRTRRASGVVQCLSVGRNHHRR